MADPAGLQDSAIQVHYQHRDAPDGQRQPAPARCLPSPQRRRRGHSGIGDHSPGQTVSSHTSQGTRTRPMVPLGRLRRRWGGRPGRPERAGCGWPEPLGAEKLTK